ncbi:MAG: hypothetical protein ACFFD4_01100 [Candidatus Odinarchaeota archaeon]
MIIPNIIFAVWLFLGYGYFGVVLKIVDRIVDDGCQINNKLTYFLIASCGMYAGMVMVFDQITAAIGLSLIIGVTLAGKLDSWQFLAITAIELLVLVIGKNLALITYVSDIAGVIVILTVSAVIDEVIATVVKKRTGEQNHAEKKPELVIFQDFLLLRPFLKVAVLILPLIDPRFTYFHAACVWLFDIAYEAVNHRLQLVDKKVELVVPG